MGSGTTGGTFTQDLTWVGRNKFDHGTPGGRYLFSNTATNHVLDENNLNESLGLGGGNPFIFRGAVFSDGATTGNFQTAQQDLDFTQVDWNEDGATDDVAIKRDLDLDGCLWWEGQGTWATQLFDANGQPALNMMGQIVPDLPCNPTNNISSPVSDMFFLTNQDYSLADPEGYTMQRDLLSSRVSQELQASWTTTSPPEGSTSVIQQLLSPAVITDPNLIVCE